MIYSRTRGAALRIPAAATTAPLHRPPPPLHRPPHPRGTDRGAHGGFKKELRKTTILPEQQIEWTAY